jgi:hypothetical protein
MTGGDGMVDGMEFAEPTPQQRDRWAREQQSLEQRIRECGLPLVGLAGPAPAPRMLGEAAARDDEIETIGLSYGDPIGGDGPLVQVNTCRWQEGTRPPTLVDLLEMELDRIEDDSVVEEPLARVELVIDGVVHPATLQCAGTRFWAAHCLHGGTDVTVVARDWELSATRLMSIGDVEPFLRERDRYLTALRAVPPPRPEPISVDFPHRVLVDTVLAQSREIQVRVREGRRPRLRGGARMGELWRAATEAQARMTDQSGESANEAVTAMVNQLTCLQENAIWFADDRLRESAIAETLIYWTELRAGVPSRPAQQAWERSWQAQRRMGREAAITPPAGRAGAMRDRMTEVFDLRRAWLDAWAEWARSHEG